MIMTLLASWIFCHEASAVKKEVVVDTFDYWCPSFEGCGDHFIKNNIMKTKDPAGLGRTCYLNGKFNSSGIFELFNVNKEGIMCRYEVIDKPKYRRIRRFEEISRPYKGKLYGHLWFKRFMKTGFDNGFYSLVNADVYEFDAEEKNMKHKVISAGEHYVSINFVDVNWESYNQTGHAITKVLRRTDEWQKNGKIFEEYDYVKGLGLVNWRWVDRVDFIDQPQKFVKQLRGGKLFKCGHSGADLCFIPNEQSERRRPQIFAWNKKRDEIGREFEVFKHTSYWNKKSGPMWYVVTRDHSFGKRLTLNKATAKYDQRVRFGDGERLLGEIPYHITTPSRHYRKYKK